MPLSNFWAISCDECGTDDPDLGMYDIDEDEASEYWVDQGYEDRDSGWWCPSCIEKEAEEQRLVGQNAKIEKLQEIAQGKDWEELSDEGVDIMDPYFSLFNCHKNDAFDKARELFIRTHGRLNWEVEIQPYVDEGIMSIFSIEPSDELKTFVNFVTAFVNEDKLKIKSAEMDGPAVDVEIKA